MGLLKFISFAFKSYHKSFFRSYTDPTKYQSASKLKAQNELVVRGQIQNFPKAQVKWVIDGDTAIVIKGRDEIVIRLDSIDCPEEGQCWGDTAKYGLMKLISRGDISLEEHGFDCHGRTLATLYVWNVEKNEWLNINERMVTLGHAWVMRRFYNHLPKDRQDKLNRLENWAKTKKVGLWNTLNPIPPWKWRHDHDC